jgi:spore maturation protein CgeB
MKLVVFGLSVSSSWGNGHATLWRGLCRGLADRGHRVVFFERDVEYYARNRDGVAFRGCDLRLYEDWQSVLPEASRELGDCDAAMVTSYCPDGPAACDAVLDSRARVRVFYDLDTPVTLERLEEGNAVEYLPAYGLSDFELVLSYTGGGALPALQAKLGARRVAPLYGSVDPEVHRPVPPVVDFAGDLSYLGTYAEDRQATLERLFIEPARRRPDLTFMIGGAQYPADFPWTRNIGFVRHLPPALHPAFYCSSRLTLNVTRRAMATMGYCPSGRLFEAAACGVPIISDAWDGLNEFYLAGTEILLCESTEQVLQALAMDPEELAVMARLARERTLAEHTAVQRAAQLEWLLEAAACRGEKEELCGA